MLKFSDKRGSVSADPLMLVMLAAVLIFDEGISSLCILAAIIIHESGHVFMMRIFGIKITRVCISGLNIGIIRNAGQKNRWTEMLVSSGGIVFNSIFVGLLLCFFSEKALPLIYSNITVAAANILPIEGLDGGDLYEMISQSIENPKLKIMVVVVKNCIIAIAVSGAVLFAVKYRNPSLGLFVLYALFFGRMKKHVAEK